MYVEKPHMRQRLMMLLFISFPLTRTAAAGPATGGAEQPVLEWEARLKITLMELEIFKIPLQDGSLHDS